MKIPYTAPYLKIIDLSTSQAIMDKCNCEAGDSAEDDIGCGKGEDRYCKSDTE